jgi:hypothetical protein
MGHAFDLVIGGNDNLLYRTFDTVYESFREWLIGILILGTDRLIITVLPPAEKHFSIAQILNRCTYLMNSQAYTGNKIIA